MIRCKQVSLVVLGAVLASVVLLNAIAAEKHDEMKLWTPDAMEWKDAPSSLPPGAKLAILEGDPNQEGMFVMRIGAPDGYHVPAHTHPKTERVTVISGTMMLAMGDRLERSAARPLSAGSFAFWPAGMKHAVWTQGETIIQIHGTGPWQINYLKPSDDPRNKSRP